MVLTHFQKSEILKCFFFNGKRRRSEIPVNCLLQLSSVVTMYRRLRTVVCIYYITYKPKLLIGVINSLLVSSCSELIDLYFYL